MDPNTLNSDGTHGKQIGWITMLTLSLGSFSSMLMLAGCRLLPFVSLRMLFSPLQLSMNMVPKILSPLVKDWAPQAFVISFKLETDATILLDKARRALDTYRHQAVVANVLDSRRGYVVVVTPETQDELILTEEDEKNEVEIECRIVSNLTSAHNVFITQQAG